MRLQSSLAIVIAAGMLAACGSGPRVDPSTIAANGPHNSQDMVNNWDAAKKAESRCTYEQAGRQIGVDSKKNDRTVSPACGDYKP